MNYSPGKMLYILLLSLSSILCLEIQPLNLPPYYIFWGLQYNQIYPGKGKVGVYVMQRLACGAHLRLLGPCASGELLLLLLWSLLG